MSREILANRLASYSCGITFNDLKADHVVKMKGFLLDWLGSTYAGKDLPPIQMLRKIARSLGGTPEATSIPDASKTNCLLASLVNGASSHIVEMDDLHRESILHPAAAILPAVLAAGERERVSGKDLIVAISVGYEMGIRVAAGNGTEPLPLFGTRQAPAGHLSSGRSGQSHAPRRRPVRLGDRIGRDPGAGLWSFSGKAQ